MKLFAIVLIAGKLFWLGFEAAKLGSMTLGMTMMIGAAWICFRSK
jgi:hypothetical protein